jgi:hypothetical protein
LYLQFLLGFVGPGQAEVNNLDAVAGLGQTHDIFGLKKNDNINSFLKTNFLSKLSG